VDDVVVLAVDDRVAGAHRAEDTAVGHLVLLEGVVPHDHIVEDQRVENGLDVQRHLLVTMTAETSDGLATRFSWLSIS